MSFQVNQYLKEETFHITEQHAFACYHKSLSKDRGDTIPPHWHNELQLVWLIEGQLSYKIEKETILLQANSLLLINSGKLHSATPHSVFVSYLCIDFSPFFLNEPLYNQFIAPLISDPDFRYRVISNKPTLLEKLSLLKSSDITNPEVLTLYSLLLDSITIVYLEHFAQVAPAANKSDTQIYLLLDYVHTHYKQKLTVAQLAEHVHINKNKCTELFNTYTSLSPMNYVIYRRLLAAKDLLLTTEKPVSEICLLVGFSHLSYFANKFKQQFHHSPLNYRQLYSEPSSTAADSIEN